MTKQKRLFSILVVFSIFLLAGCSQSSIEPADAGIKTYCKAILDRDDESTQKVKLPKDELEKSMLSVFVNTFQSSSNSVFTKEQSERIGYPNRRKTPSFSYGDIRRVWRICESN